MPAFLAIGASGPGGAAAPGTDPRTVLMAATAPVFHHFVLLGRPLEVDRVLTCAALAARGAATVP